MRIDFHEFKDLTKISRSHCLKALQPGVLCRSSPSTLLSAAVDENSGELVSKITFLKFCVLQSQKDKGSQLDLCILPGGLMN